MSTCYGCGAEYPYLAGLCAPCQSAKQLTLQTEELKRQGAARDAERYNNHSSRPDPDSDWETNNYDPVYAEALITKARREMAEIAAAEAADKAAELAKQKADADAVTWRAKYGELFAYFNSKYPTDDIALKAVHDDAFQCIGCDYHGPMFITGTITTRRFFKKIINVLECPRCDVKMRQE